MDKELEIEKQETLDWIRDNKDVVIVTIDHYLLCDDICCPICHWLEQESKELTNEDV